MNDRFVSILVGATAILASCSRTVPPLVDGPKWVEGQKYVKAREAIRQMTPAQVAELEAAVAKNPEDMVARRKLLEFYAMNRETPARRTHILWLIANHPEHELAGSWESRITDPAWYELAKPLWLRAIKRPAVQPGVLANAATFFIDWDKVIAEELLLRGQTLDPQGTWSARLGELYYRVLMGSNAPMQSGTIRSVSIAEAHGPQATAVRAKLAGTKDAALLRITGMRLMAGSGGKRLVDFDHGALGLSYLERALELDPQSPKTREWLVMIKGAESRRFTFSIPFRESYEAVAELPENEQLAWLMRLASTSYMRGEVDNKKERWALARKCTEEVLRLAPTKRNDAYYSQAVFGANLMSGLFAMEDSNLQRAVRYMLAATEVPPTDYLAQSADFAAYRLAAWLLQDGERETVITFLERLAAMPHSPRESLKESIESIRKGFKPGWYPRPPPPR